MCDYLFALGIYATRICDGRQSYFPMNEIPHELRKSLFQKGDIAYKKNK